MGKLHTFVYVLKRTFTDLGYYQEVSKTSFGFSFKYFLVFFVLYAVIGTAFLGINLVPNLTQVLEGLPDKLVEVYPEELVVKVENGVVSTNVQEPYYIPIDQVEKKFWNEKVLGDNTEIIKNLVVIDTAGQVENFDSYQTAVLVTDRVIVSKDNEGTRFQKIDSSVNLVLDQGMVRMGVEKIKPFIGYVVPMMMIAIYIGMTMGMIIYYLVYLVFFALLLWLLSKLINRELGFGTSYRWGLHLCTISATIIGIMGLWGLRLGFPFMQTIFLLILGYLALTKVENSQSEKVVEIEKPK